MQWNVLCSIYLCIYSLTKIALDQTITLKMAELEKCPVCRRGHYFTGLYTWWIVLNYVSAHNTQRLNSSNDHRMIIWVSNRLGSETGRKNERRVEGSLLLHCLLLFFPPLSYPDRKSQWFNYKAPMLVKLSKFNFHLSALSLYLSRALIFSRSSRQFSTETIGYVSLISVYFIGIWRTKSPHIV